MTSQFARVIDVLEAALGRPTTDWPIAAEKVASQEPLDVLVETILSQNTTDTNSHAAYLALRRRWHTWREVADADAEDIEETIRRGGLAASKSHTIKRILQDLAAAAPDGEPSLRQLREVADDDAIMAQLMAMKGVGPKTAACVLVFGLGRDRFPVDTHIFRVAGRTGLLPAGTAAAQSREAAQTELERTCPAGRKLDAHLLLIQLGRTNCKAKPAPLCSTCPLDSICAHRGVARQRHKSK
jgi:endonuclease-3